MALTIEQLGRRTKEKYPQYRNLSDAEVGNLVSKKYPQYISGPAPATQAKPFVRPEKKSLLGFIGKDITGKATEEDRPRGLGGFAADVFSSTAGNVFRLLGRPMRARETQVKAKVQENIQGARLSVIQNADKFIEMANKTKDPDTKRKYLDLANRTLQRSEDIGESAQEVSRGTPQAKSTAGEIKGIAGEAIGAFSTLAPAARGVGFGLRGPISVAPKTPPATLGAAVKTGARTGGKFGAAFGASEALKDDKSALEIAGRTLSGAATGGAFVAVTGAAGFGIRKGTAALRARRVPAEDKASAATGRIIQGEPRDIPRGQRVFSAADDQGNPFVDTRGVKKYEGLSGRLQKGIDHVQEGKRGVLGRIKDRTRLSSLTRTETQHVDGSVITTKSNPVRKALQDLHQLYTKTDNPTGAARIKTLTSHADKRGLTPLQIDDLAVEYGKNARSFSKAGDALRGTNAVSQENTRTALKELSRSFFPDENLRGQDRLVSDMIRVKDLVDDMAKKTNSFEQRVVKGNIIQQAARKIEPVFNFATLGGPKAFLRKMLGTDLSIRTDYVSIEKDLARNIILVNRLNGADDSVVLRFFENLFRQGLLRASKASGEVPPIPGDALNRALIEAFSSPSNFGRSTATEQRDLENFR